jgi:hypothetical protein
MLSLNATAQTGGMPLLGWLAAAVLLSAGTLITIRAWRKKA